MKLVRTIFLFLVISPVILLCQFTGGFDDGYSRTQYRIPGADTNINLEKFSWINDGYSRSQYKILGADTNINPKKFSWINGGYSKADFLLSNYQGINLNLGWNLISSNTEPYNLQIAVLLSGISGNINVIKNGYGQFYAPAWGVNSIGIWNKLDGYQISVNSSCILSLPGTELVPENNTYNLSAGWHLISYIRNSPLPVEQGFATILSKIVVVKNNSGGMFVPSLGVNTIGNLIPSQGYWIYLSEPAVLTYPAN